MQAFKQHVNQLFLTLLILGLGSCAYYNTFYNAEQFFDEAQQVTRENQSDIISREEINLYSKSIEKSKKLIQKYPNSKYLDDAQFLIAKSYYYKGDYLIAKRHFDELALNFGNSPYVAEVPLWMGRCLVKLGDMQMAQHEASRILRGPTSRSLQADALLLMGEIAIQQDSLLVAEKYLEQVIDRSPDGFTKAQAQFQVGRMRENKKDYQAALEAYKAVSKYKPSESLKVESIIRQTTMLKALDRDQDAMSMIGDMLESEKFVDIRGQLEVELGKLYLSTGDQERAEKQFLKIIEDYSRQEVAAEASFYLGELKLVQQQKYKAAKEAYAGIKTQSVRSDYVDQGAQRIKQVDRYMTLQLDYVNLQRQLAGLKPLEKKKATNKNRSSRASRSRGRSRAASNPADARSLQGQREKSQAGAAQVVTEVTAEDSLRFLALMDENRYALAEYMLFEFSRVDTTLSLLDSLESASQDSSMKQQAAYMRYYALDNIQGDEEQAKSAFTHIQQNYPAFYDDIVQQGSNRSEEKQDPREAEYLSIALLFEQGNLTEANNAYQQLRNDSTASAGIRAKASFNAAWLNDHYLYDREAALEGYEYLVTHFANDPLVENAQKRLKLLKAAAPEPNPPVMNESPEGQSTDDVQESQSETFPFQSKSDE